MLKSRSKFSSNKCGKKKKVKEKTKWLKGSNFQICYASKPPLTTVNEIVQVLPETQPSIDHYSQVSNDRFGNDSVIINPDFDGITSPVFVNKDCFSLCFVDISGFTSIKFHVLGALRNCYHHQIVCKTDQRYFL